MIDLYLEAAPNWARNGLPLDRREMYTKSDWILWTAVLVDDIPTFQDFAQPVHAFMSDTVHRVPMSDWIFMDKPGRKGFKARCRGRVFYENATIAV